MIELEKPPVIDSSERQFRTKLVLVKLGKPKTPTALSMA